MACAVANTQGSDVEGWFMANPHDNISVGSITLVYSSLRCGWIVPGRKVIKNPLKAQRIAELMNNKKVAA